MADLTPEDAISALLNKNPLDRFPTSEDAKFALQQGFSHANPNSPYLEGKKFTHLPNISIGELSKLVSGRRVGEKATLPLVDSKMSGTTISDVTHPGITDLYARNALAAKRSALATMGFDPPSMALDFTPKNSNFAGSYIPPTGQTYVQAFRHETDPQVMLHESLHKGIHKLQETGYWDPAWNDLGIPMPKGQSERFPDGNAGKYNESVVRWLMSTKMGDPEGGPVRTQQKAEAKRIFDDPSSSRRKQLEAMEAAASRYLKDRNPRGPR